MSVLEKILKEVEEKIKFAEKVMVKPPCDKLDEIANDTAEAFIQAYKECKEIIHSYMDEAENDGWIPVSERLPEDGTYLCTLDGELCGIDEAFTGICGIENGKWDEEGCVIAWQPLPEPYKGE